MRDRPYAGQGSQGPIPRRGISLSDQDPQERDAAREEARRKLIGRAMVIGFVALIAVYALFTFLGRR